MLQLAAAAEAFPHEREEGDSIILYPSSNKDVSGVHRSKSYLTTARGLIPTYFSKVDLDFSKFAETKF